VWPSSSHSRFRESRAPRAPIDPPFDAISHDAIGIEEVWSSRSDPDRHFESREFEVPETLALVVAGLPGREGISLALEDATGRER